MISDVELEQLARRVSNELVRKKAMLSTAESCTGGWIGKVCTDVEGSSRWFDRGFLTYSNEAKHDMLGVAEALLLEHGAVSELVVQAMAEGALRNSQADYSVAVSGIAGPGGGAPNKPVGLVWLAWSYPGGLDSESRRFNGDRDAVRRQTVEAALRGILARIC